MQVYLIFCYGDSKLAAAIALGNGSERGKQCILIVDDERDITFVTMIYPNINICMMTGYEAIPADERGNDPVQSFDPKFLLKKPVDVSADACRVQ